MAPNFHGPSALSPGRPATHGDAAQGDSGTGHEGTSSWPPMVRLIGNWLLIRDYD